MRHLFLLLLGLLFLARPSTAQEVHIEANFEAAYAVQSTLFDLFDGMYEGDSEIVRNVFHEEARLYTARGGDEGPVLNETPVESFIEAVASPREERWDEHIWDVHVQADGALASAWMQYAFYLGDELSHCGVNAVQFIQIDDSWKITQLTDTRRTENCEVPASVEDDRARGSN